MSISPAAKKITLTVFLLISLFTLSGWKGCWIFGFIWDACYKTIPPPCCKTEQFKGKYVGYAFTKPAMGPYSWGDRVELLIRRYVANNGTKDESLCIKEIPRGYLRIYKKNSITGAYERTDNWYIKISCDVRGKYPETRVPFNFTLSDWNNTESLKGEGKLWLLSWGKEVDLQFNDGAGLVEIKLKEKP